MSVPAERTPHPAAAALRAAVAIPPRPGQRIVDAVAERLHTLHRVSGVLVHEATHRGVVLVAGDLRVELWRSGHWVAQQKRRTCATSSSISHGAEWLRWVADRIDDEARNGRLPKPPSR